MTANAMQVVADEEYEATLAQYLRDEAAKAEAAKTAEKAVETAAYEIAWKKQQTERRYAERALRLKWVVPLVDALRAFHPEGQVELRLIEDTPDTSPNVEIWVRGVRVDNQVDVPWNNSTRFKVRTGCYERTSNGGRRELTYPFPLRKNGERNWAGMAEHLNDYATRTIEARKRQAMATRNKLMADRLKADYEAKDYSEAILPSAATDGKVVLNLAKFYGCTPELTESQARNLITALQAFGISPSYDRFETFRNERKAAK